MATETAIPVPRLIGTDGLGALFEALVADGYPFRVASSCLANEEGPGLRLSRITIAR